MRLSPRASSPSSCSPSAAKRREDSNFDVEDMLRRIGLDRHLSPTRSNGLHAMVKRVRSIAANAEGLYFAAEHGGDCGMHCTSRTKAPLAA
ncbi:MAG: SufE family protein [Gemmataceae bacterium]